MSNVLYLGDKVTCTLPYASVGFPAVVIGVGRGRGLSVRALVPSDGGEDDFRVSYADVQRLRPCLVCGGLRIVTAAERSFGEWTERCPLCGA